jgi:hypothetical protein
MLKLYKNIDNLFHYWETWDKDEKTGIVHWGIVGSRGEDKEVKSTLLENFRKKIQKEIATKTKSGFDEIAIDDHYSLLIEFAVDGMGAPEDVEKRTRLQNRMDQTLGWTGLGYCDGGSMGSGTMEVVAMLSIFK